jgi:hypothetical protein
LGPKASAKASALGSANRRGRQAKSGRSSSPCALPRTGSCGTTLSPTAPLVTHYIHCANYPRHGPTGVPNKDYRGAQQGSRAGRRPLPPVLRANEPKTRPFKPLGSPPGTTGVPDKDYRGARQGLPGCPTKTTGVPDKNYRGARQKLPGCPTKTTGVPDKWPFLKLLQNGGFRVAFFGAFVFVYLVVLCC